MRFPVVYIALLLFSRNEPFRPDDSVKQIKE